MKNPFLAFLVIILVSCAGAVEPAAPFDQQGIDDAVPTDELSRDKIALGEVSYNVNCAACHGQNLEGEEE
jgi:mono/diheme cytochrome c family protein